jgi:hypothetical protein
VSDAQYRQQFVFVLFHNFVVILVAVFERIQFIAFLILKSQFQFVLVL